MLTASCRRPWLVCLLALVGACGDSSADVEDSPRATKDLASVGAATDLRCVADPSRPQKNNYGQPGPYPVATLDVTFEDTSRAIPRTDSHPAAPSRKLVTTIYYPASETALPFVDPSAAAGGPFPMLMYSHGFASTRDEGATLAKRASSWGFVVVAPDFPLSNLFANGGNPDDEDVTNQAGDISFLIDQMVALSHQRGHVLANAIDGSRVGATGVSMGGLTALLVAFHPKLADPRIKATAPIAALCSFFLEGFYHTRELPMLLVHGDNDAFIDYERNSRTAWERAQPNARLLTVRGGSHAGFAIPFDPGTVALLNLLIGKSGSDPTNPDGFSCGGVGDGVDARVPTFPSDLGGSRNFIDESQVGVPLDACSGDEYTKPALDARQQVDLTAAAVTSFFQAQIGKTRELQQDACRYLLHEIPATPSATVE